MILVLLAAAITTIALVYLLVYILVNGIPYLNADLFSWEYTSENVSVVPAMINTVIMAVISLVFAIPFGVGSAIYLVEYAKKGNKLVKVVRVTAENTDRYSIHRIWSVWYAVLCNRPALEILHSGRCLYPGDHGSAGYFKNHRGSADGSSGFLPGRKFRSWRRKTSYDL